MKAHRSSFVFAATIALLVAATFHPPGDRGRVRELPACACQGKAAK